MSEKNLKEEAFRGMEEFELAWQEFFKDKPEPKTDEEDRNQQEEFHHWYNHVRKQSDTGKTPAEMYEEIYGKEPPENLTKISRMMNFEWDEDYDEELIGFVYELQEYDNEEGYKLNYEDVRKKLEPSINGLIEKGNKTLDWLHDLLKNGKTWSCIFALEILKEIKSEKSIPYLIKCIIKNKEDDNDDLCEKAMLALANIGVPAITPLIKEVKNQFEKKKFNFYLVGALTEIKNEEVYNFMKAITEDYIKNEEKYDEWFYIDAFTSDFDKQGEKEIISLLESILKLDRTSKHERIEIQETIESIRDPEEFKRKLEKQIEETKPIFEKYMNKQTDEQEEIDEEEFRERMWTPEEDLEIQFKCYDCQKKQNINPGLIKVLGDKNHDLSFENELMCKFCFSNNLKPTKQGGREIMFQSIGTLAGYRNGVISAESKVYVENKSIPYKDSYKYILKRIKQEPKNAELYLRAGNVAKSFNRYHEAIRHYEKTIELRSKLIAAYLNLVEIYEFRYKYYGIEDAKVSAVFYLNEMMDIFRTQDFDTLTLKNKDIIVQFIGEKSESLGVYFPELIKIPLSKKKKVGRNEPCPCGSGKKYKKCCLNKENKNA